MGPFFRGFGYFLSKPNLWPYAIGPMLVAAIVYAAILTTGMILFGVAIERWVEGPDWLQGLVQIGGRILAFIILAYIGNIVYLAISGLFSGLLWEKLSLAVERDLYGDAPDRPIGCGTILGDAVLRMIFAGFVGGLSFVLGFCGVLPVIIAAGLLGLIDFTSPAYFRRGVAVTRQFNRVLQAKAAPGFALSCGFLSLLPFLFVLFFPAMVTGGTILVREAEGD